MNKDRLQKLVDSAVALHREVTAKNEQLKRLKADLVDEARLHPDTFETTPSGGERWTAEGTNGCIARVSFPAPTLISELEDKCDLAEQCRALAGDVFRKLFTPVKIYHLVENFRDEAKAQLPADKATALTAACENAASPRVSFETAKQKSNATGKSK